MKAKMKVVMKGIGQMVETGDIQDLDKSKLSKADTPSTGENGGNLTDPDFVNKNTSILFHLYQQTNTC